MNNEGPALREESLHGDSVRFDTDSSIAQKATGNRAASEFTRANAPHSVPTTSASHLAVPHVGPYVTPAHATGYTYHHYNPEYWNSPTSKANLPAPQPPLPGSSSAYTYSGQRTTPNTVNHVLPRPKEISQHWDTSFKAFLKDANFTQTLRGFENDMLVLNPDWEKGRVRKAVGTLVQDLLRIDGEKRDDQSTKGEPEEHLSLNERKLGYGHFAEGVEPRTPSSVTKSISRFLAQNRARNDASNRQEFLVSLAEKRRRLSVHGDYVQEGVVSSCARVDAKTQNRDLQMKYDVAKNEDGPLRKTVHSKNKDIKVEEGGHETANLAGKKRPFQSTDEEPSADRHPALDERLRDIETHLAVRYVPSPPRSLLDRLKYIEDHIIHLETEYPPWAALHFNQPRRGWPPPPRPTPIIVPSHLTSSTEIPQPPVAEHAFVPQESSGAESAPTVTVKGKGKQVVRPISSLHRAVMERLEVQKAMNDLAGKE